MNIKYLRTLLLISLISLCGIQSNAQSIQLDKQHKGRKHNGFYLSLSPGVSLSNIDVKDNDGSTLAKGVGNTWDMKIGAAINEDLILHATYLTHNAFKPKLYDTDNGLDGAKADDLNISEVFFGAGLTYYTPKNVLLSTSIGFGRFMFSDIDTGDDSHSDSGFSFQLKAGKEWWVSPRWGIGAAAYYHHTNAVNQKDTSDEESIRGNSFGFIISTTFNGRK